MSVQLAQLISTLKLPKMLGLLIISMTHSAAVCQTCGVDVYSVINPLHCIDDVTWSDHYFKQLKGTPDLPTSCLVAFFNQSESL